MKKIILCFAFLSLNLYSYANDKGVRFMEFDNWEAVLNKAKTENKSIFIDFFTTWCGPCRQMDLEVYTNQAVAEFFNENFISVKIQMDRTKEDDEQIRKWYSEAIRLGKDYSITAYPTLIFISSNGKITNRVMGFTKSSALINQAKYAINPKSNYVDNYAIFGSELTAYNKNPNPEKLPLLIEKAYETHQWKWVDSLSNAYLIFLRKKDASKFYNREALKIISKVDLNSLDPLFKQIYENTKLVDSLLDEPGTARTLIDRVIRKEYLDKIIKSKVPFEEINWDSLLYTISKRYNVDYSKRAVQAAKVRFYELNRMDSLFIKEFISMVDNYGPETVLIYGNLGGAGLFKTEKRRIGISLIINSFCWELIFKTSNNNNEIVKAIEYMKRIKEVALQSNDYGARLYLDTYANLQYKYGNILSAIENEMTALDNAKKNNAPESEILGYNETIIKMRRGIPTWPSIK